MIKIYYTLRNTAYPISFAFVTSCGIIRKNKIAVPGEIVRNIHIGIMPTAAKSVSNNHDPALTITYTIQITGKHLSLIRRECIFSTV